MPGQVLRAFAPGRVNLIGEHVDYAGGPVLPMAIDLGTTIELWADESQQVTLTSADQAAAAVVDVPVPVGPRHAGWGALVAACAAEARRSTGAVGTVTTTLPIGAGLSSSSSFAVALLLALGMAAGDAGVALAAQRAETTATGVPGGIMDQLASVCGVDGHALLMDCATLAVHPVRLPDSVAILVVHSGQPRLLADSAYAQRRADVEAAAALIGPLPEQRSGAEAGLSDPTLRARARHVITECERVRAVAADPMDLDVWAEALASSHASLRDDFEVSTPALDACVAHLVGQPGVIGARLTGAGFGGCVVAMVDTEVAAAERIDVGGRRSWRVRPSRGASVEAIGRR